MLEVFTTPCPQILHYLGLDHIGHLAGPASPLVPPKLEEMGEVLEKVWRGLEEERGELPPLLLVCGDHGMADGGSHGGARYGPLGAHYHTVLVCSAWPRCWCPWWCWEGAWPSSQGKGRSCSRSTWCPYWPS